MWNKILMVFLVGIGLATTMSCGQYKSRFGGHKKDTHLSAEESKSVHLPKSRNVKAKDKRFDIPKTRTSNVEETDPDKLAIPKGFK